MVTFRQHNLLDRLRDASFDLVFLKNVLIYFGPESKKMVMDNVRAADSARRHAGGRPRRRNRRTDQGLHAAAILALPTAATTNGTDMSDCKARRPRTT